MSSEENKNLKEQVVDIAGISSYVAIFRLLPKPLRLLGYFSIILGLPVYLGLTPRLVEDFFNTPVLNWEIRLQWREPHQWTGRYSSGIDKTFAVSRWTGSTAANLTDDNAMMIKPLESVFYKLKSDIFGLYDFYVKFDVEISDGQNELYWVARADREHTSYYKFRLKWNESDKFWQFDAFTTGEGEDESEPLFVNEHRLEVSPLQRGDKLSVLLYAKECIFDHRFLVDRANFDMEDSGEGAVLASTAFAERPCATYGDFGLLAPSAPASTKLQSMEICSQSEIEAMDRFCGDFKSYYRPDEKKEN